MKERALDPQPRLLVVDANNRVVSEGAGVPAGLASVTLTLLSAEAQEVPNALMLANSDGSGPRVATTSVTLSVTRGVARVPATAVLSVVVTGTGFTLRAVPNVQIGAPTRAVTVSAPAFSVFETAASPAKLVIFRQPTASVGKQMVLTAGPEVWVHDTNDVPYIEPQQQSSFAIALELVAASEKKAGVSAAAAATNPQGLVMGPLFVRTSGGRARFSNLRIVASGAYTLVASVAAATSSSSAFSSSAADTLSPATSEPIEVTDYQAPSDCNDGFYQKSDLTCTRYGWTRVRACVT